MKKCSNSKMAAIRLIQRKFGELIFDEINADEYLDYVSKICELYNSKKRKKGENVKKKDK